MKVLQLDYLELNFDDPKDGDYAVCRASFEPLPEVRRVGIDGDRIFLHPLDGVREGLGVPNKCSDSYCD